MKQFYRYTRFGICIFILLICKISKGQDVQYSQFYANVLHLNPAFAGSAHNLRGIAHQRLQWPGLDAKYTTSSVSIDNYFQKSGGGFGALFLKDWQGTNRISSTEIRFQYAQEISLSSYFSVRAGAELNYIDRYLNYSFLTFPDQFNTSGFTGEASQEPFGMERKGFLDMGIGGIIYSETFWFGASLHHINRPDMSFYGHPSRLPAKASFVSGYKIILKEGRQGSYEPSHEEIFITPTIHYKFQGKSDQLDLGIYGLYQRILMGAWYRGLPFLKEYRPGLQNNESIVLLVGYKVNSISVSYSYDFTLSKLSRAGTGGAHELNITYIHSWPPKRRKLPKKLPCPNFK